ncbi:uncharacterized mitochondrial protein AtMg00810-like [Telopea speciosissima]|uniref:uncharacterized mitochondrial protein AtMg00810-like n=1 Tax=Telopea speciosissima TaxID=54955 RepID=UPI001CC59D6E|nr:uncharacterized mitochondrial protein AtMg00810-like [Telopea speciosissima]
MDTPLEATTRLKKKDGDPIDKGHYQQLMGKLISLSHTRPDITCAEKGFSCQRNHLRIAAYTDVDWGANPDWKSTSGYCTIVGGNLVAWRSKKQNVVARSSVKSVVLWPKESVSYCGFKVYSKILVVLFIV